MDTSTPDDKAGGALKVFATELNELAAEVSDPRVAAVAERVAAPLRVAVRGRRGAGRGTVARALAGGQLTVQPVPVPGDSGYRDARDAGRDADVVVYVVAEAVKPEDVAAVAALTQPTLALLNKADLHGRAGVAGVAARLGVPTEPMSGLLAEAASSGLDDTLWTALRTLADQPADLSCARRFLAGAHPVPRAMRLRLCETLDLPGITHAVTAVRQGWPTGRICALLRRLSGVDRVAQRIGAIGAGVRYQRLSDAGSELEALAVGDARIGDFLASDDAVLARMTAAAAVIEAAGLTLDGPDAGSAAGGGSVGGGQTQLRRAIRWQRYSRGPVTAVHRACGTDIARGALRLWALAEDSRPERA